MQTDRPIRPKQVTPVSLGKLVSKLPDVQEIFGDFEVEIRDICLDSRLATSGALYVGLAGRNTHGSRFSEKAKENGAVGVLTDEAGRSTALASELPTIIVRDARTAMAYAAAALFDNPASRMTMFGITGTNGKTTTTFLLEAAIQDSPRSVSSIGTMGFRLNEKAIESLRTTVTTPESPDLQALLAVMAERGSSATVMEVSSHALALERVTKICFDVAGFINLGRDHLDFHGTIDNYFESKAKLFTPPHSKKAVISIDDPYGKILVGRLTAADRPFVTTGFSAEADYRIESWSPISAGGARLSVTTPNGKLVFEIELPGEFNVRNAVTALAMGELAGFTAEDLLPGLGRAQVPGRMQRVQLDGDAPTVYVDFAHTPQAISSALEAIHTDGKVIVVVGAGGDRDPLKREPMGKAAVTGADIAVITDDNPRTEDPALIRQAVLKGAKEAALGTNKTVIDGGSRANSIALALSMAQQNDTVAVLGKGHETGQIIGDQVLPFDDVVEVKSAWSSLKEKR